MTYSRHNVLEVPELALRPSDEGIPSPQFDATYLKTLRDSGYLALGTVSVISSSSQGVQKILMLHHREYDQKIQPGGAWGFPAETARGVYREGQIQVESALQTMFRGLSEEIGVQVGFPALKARAIGAYASCAWPRGYYREGYAFGVMPIMHFVDPAEADRLVKTYAPQAETDDIAFMTPAEIRTLPETALRVGTLACLDIAANSPFFVPEGPFTPVPVPERSAQARSVDIILGELIL
jgi:hypothetical protein